MIFLRSILKLSGTVFLIFTIFPSLLLAEKPIFQFVREIGDDSENYMFATIAGIAITDKKEIFIADTKLINIRRFSWDGKFIAKVGQLGRGPGDFITLDRLQWFDNKLFVHDSYNKRIAITDSQLKRFDYIKTDMLGMKLGGAFPIRNAPIILDSNRILVINSHYDDDEGRLIIFDRNQNIVQRFFCHLPVDIADKKDSKFFAPLTHPNMGVNHEKKQILVTFDYPDREILFYLYDFSGRLIRHFTYPQAKGFRFPMEALEHFSDAPDNHTMVFDIYGYKEYYMVFLADLIDYNKPSAKMKWSFLFFREKGEFLYRMPWKVRFLTINADGYLGGVKEVDEELKVFIYKFDPKALEAVAKKFSQ